MINRDITPGGPNDAAAVMCGAPWVMPSRVDFDELVNDDHTTKEWVENYQDTGASGVLITSRINGNYIFLPATGDFDGIELKGYPTAVHLWTTDYNSGNEITAFEYRFFEDGIIDSQPLRRSRGLCIRAIQKGS